MIGIWSLLLSVVFIAVTGASAVLAFRSGHRLAIVFGLDAVLIAGLGVLLNASTYGELQAQGLLLFGALPLVFAAVAIVLAFTGKQADDSYRAGSLSSLE